MNDPKNILETEPSFEDDFIKAWISPKDNVDIDELKPILTIDFETEEIFESRAYSFAVTDRSVSLLLDAMPPELVLNSKTHLFDQMLASEFIKWALENLGFKFLAKRNKETQRITSAVYFFDGSRKRIIGSWEDQPEEEYQERIYEFEAAFITGEEKLLKKPKIVGREQWVSYAERALNSLDLPGSPEVEKK